MSFLQIPEQPQDDGRMSLFFLQKGKLRLIIARWLGKGHVAGKLV